MSDSTASRPGLGWIGRMFLVQLSPDASPGSGRCCGRVQHVRTEDATHFATLDELARFMALHAEEVPPER
jgi:hypothetical protein